MTLGAGATYAFTPTLFGTVQYLIQNRNSDVPGFAFTQNILLAGVRKTF